MTEASNRPEQPNEAVEPDALAGLPFAVERALRHELGALFETADAPPSVGAALARAAAGAQPRALPAARRFARVASAGLAAAAALAVVLYGLRDLRAPEGERFVTGAAATEAGDVDVADFDGSGRVDVWDAYLVVRALEGGAELSHALDLDRDGAVTRVDADMIAQRAVEVVR